MFNFKNKESKEEKKYRGTKIYLKRIENVDPERFLAILFSMVEGYAKQEQRMPEKIVLSEKNHKMILDYNKTLIEKREDKEYVLGVEVEIEKNRRFKR